MKRLLTHNRLFGLLRLAFAGILLIGVSFALACGGGGSVPAPAPTDTVVWAPTPTPEPVPTATPTFTPVPTPTPSATPEPTPAGLLGGAYAEKFTKGGIELTETSYRTRDVSVTVTKVFDNTTYCYDNGKPFELTYYVADIYIKDVTLLRVFRTRKTAKLVNLCAEVNAAVAITGDFCQARTLGLIVDNGEVVRETPDPDRDVLVLYRDGTMKAYLAGAVPIDEILASEPWQAWCFGPILVENGEAATSFNMNFGKLAYIRERNPRAAVGYYEPGHYCFVQVDGRNNGYSQGLSAKDLAALMQGLGCTLAYNLDGGDTAQMAFLGERVSTPSGHRNPGDILYIGYADAAVDDGDYTVSSFGTAQP